MRAFSEAKEHFLVHLRPEDVRDRCTGDGPSPSLEDVHTALAQLVEWGNLQAEPDTSRVTTVEDFYRARYLYQITHEGEAAEVALATYEQLLGRHGSLQTVALRDIRAQLQALLTLLHEDAPDPAKGHLLLRDITRVFTDLAENARAFMTGLGRGLDLRMAQRDSFLAYKDRLIDYLHRFVGDLVTQSGEIAGLIGALDRHPAFRPLLGLIAAREAEDQAPDPEAIEQQQDAMIAARFNEWLAHWDGLKGWFIGNRNHPSQADLLRSRARRAIAQLLEAVVRLNERRLGRSDRSADFRTLATWFMDCDSDEDAHRLWRGAFGLNPARHLSIDSDTLSLRELNPIPPGIPWGDAQPLAISPRLRETGSYRKRGAPPKVRDRHRDKRKLAGLLARESAQTRAARRRLATGTEMHLSEIGELDRDSFGLFLQLLGEALAAASSPEEKVSTITSDGGIAIEMTPLDAESRASIPTPDGVFSGRDHIVRITDRDAPTEDLLQSDAARISNEAAA